jgi:hypothetical protein
LTARVISAIDHADALAAISGTAAKLIVPVTHNDDVKKAQMGERTVFPLAASKTPATKPIVV